MLLPNQRKLIYNYLHDQGFKLTKKNYKELSNLLKRKIDVIQTTPVKPASVKPAEITEEDKKRIKQSISNIFSNI